MFHPTKISTNSRTLLRFRLEEEWYHSPFACSKLRAASKRIPTDFSALLPFLPGQASSAASPAADCSCRHACQRQRKILVLNCCCCRWCSTASSESILPSSHQQRAPLLGRGTNALPAALISLLISVPRWQRYTVLFTGRWLRWTRH